MYRKATEADIEAIAEIYEQIHTEEEKGNLTIGWVRDVYPVRATAAAAVERGDMFVCEEEGRIVASAIINQIQVDSYADGNWEHDAPPEEVMVLHTLVVSPSAGKRKIGSGFVTFYEDCARNHNAHYLRMDTNAKNLRARAMYQKLGYREADIVPCVFNGIDGVQLVLLEKKLS